MTKDQSEPNEMASPDEQVYLTVPISSSLLITLDAAAALMEIAREDLVQQILNGWMKYQTLPLHGKDRLCNLKPDFEGRE
ncbi:MAG: hypothetical protein LUQ50_06870 [Methanospirillum sp.]|uniref:hypothetical protein n=1 Tax=Methanospirillum sp. TaxID=45200 RepID=UPI0023696D42|nr:hypothetical protein [Methanospirillum sp.]MDD1728777.1 hypothetical protein [Methanospirillum sp.]